MAGLDYNSIAAHCRSAARRLRVLRRSLWVLLLLACGVAYAVSARTPTLAEVVCVAAPCPAPADAATATEWPRTVLRFWLTLPALVAR